MCPGGEVRVEKEEQYRKVFRHLDVNGDGKITEAELRRCVVAGGMREEAGGMKLGMEEFVRMMMEEEEEEEGLREAFEMYEDGEKGGVITARSLKRMLSRLGDKTSLGDCEAMISAFDLDGDGVLSFHEFKIMMS